MNDIYQQAENAYLALPRATEGPAFDPTRLSPEKLAYVVGRLEGLSVTENVHKGDLLGEFFEHIVSQDFTQSKGQFFTPQKLVRFMLALSDVTQLVNTGSPETGVGGCGAYRKALASLGTRSPRARSAAAVNPLRGSSATLRPSG